MKIGLIGFGTVGKGAYDILQGRSDLEVKYVLDKRDLPDLIGAKKARDLDEILSDGEVETVIELIGGLHPAYEFISAALKAKKNVVTANKLLMSLHYEELIALARENGVSLRFSAAAGGGIPWLVNLQRAQRGTTLQQVYGIMNGTTNFILDAMQTAGEEFDKALAEAQRLGFAEADPSSDIDALDTRHKTTLSANIAFGVALEDEAVDAFGIRTVKRSDIAEAMARGYAIKLIGKACRVGDGEEFAVWVEPAMVPLFTPEGNIHGCDNIIAFEGEYIGKTHFLGAGAGRYPTGYAVAQDCLDIAAGLGGLYNENMAQKSVSNEKECHRYYLRTTFTHDPFFTALEKTPWGDGFETGPVSVREMHDFAARAAACGHEVFLAGFLWN